MGGIGSDVIASKEGIEPLFWLTHSIFPPARKSPVRQRSANKPLFMVCILLAVPLCLAIHLGSIALAGFLFGIGLREVRLGFGPRIARLGKLNLGLFPLGGFVKFDTIEGDFFGAPMPAHPLEHAPFAVRILIALSGCIALLALACGALGAAADAAFLTAPPQILFGALSPFTGAQALLADADAVARTQSFAVIVGMVAAKMAAFNLLPYPGSNGGQVVAECAKALRLSHLWSEQITGVFFLALLAVAFSWLAALVVFALHG